MLFMVHYIEKSVIKRKEFAGLVAAVAFVMQTPKSVLVRTRNGRVVETIISSRVCV